MSRHLVPLQADLDNGSVVLQHLTLSVSMCVCMCKWSFVWPDLHCHLPHSPEREVQAICSLTHRHCTEAAIDKPGVRDITLDKYLCITQYTVDFKLASLVTFPHWLTSVLNNAF